MANTITEKCIECGSCEPFCLQEGIDYIDGKYVIVQERCIGCGTCKQYCWIDGAIVEAQPVLIPVPV